MRDTELYEGLLGLKVPWRVKAVKMDVEGRASRWRWNARSAQSGENSSFSIIRTVA